MNRKVIYTFSRIGFFLLGGVFGLMARAPRRGPIFQATALPQKNSVVTQVITPNAVIPVTGEAQPGTGILLVYLFVGFATLFLILTLLSAANKQTAPSVRRREPPDES